MRKFTVYNIIKYKSTALEKVVLQKGALTKTQSHKARSVVFISTKTGDVCSRYAFTFVAYRCRLRDKF